MHVEQLLFLLLKGFGRPRPHPVRLSTKASENKFQSANEEDDNALPALDGNRHGWKCDVEALGVTPPAHQG